MYFDVFMLSKERKNEAKDPIKDIFCVLKVRTIYVPATKKQQKSNQTQSQQYE